MEVRWWTAASFRFFFLIRRKLPLSWICMNVLVLPKQVCDTAPGQPYLNYLLPRWKETGSLPAALEGCMLWEGPTGHGRPAINADFPTSLFLFVSKMSFHLMLCVLSPPWLFWKHRGCSEQGLWAPTFGGWQGYDPCCPPCSGNPHLGLGAESLLNDHAINDIPRSNPAR